MSRENLKNSNGRQLGSVDYAFEGHKKALYTPGGKMLGSYDPRKNETKTVGGKVIGRGDLLLTLLED